MVKRRYKRKHLTESSDESDSDDFYEETPSSEAESKKYSLRARRGANLAEDFDYDIAEENETNTLAGTEILRSDDDDYEQEIPVKKTSVSSTQKNKLNEKKPMVSNCTIRKYREKEIIPELSKSESSSNKMIDFEDVIRADILVNQSKIDYDSVIEKSEIKFEKREPETIQSNKAEKKKSNKEPPKKRGRKPKIRPLPDDEISYLNQDTTGLPINTVLGVTESLYELAERYHLQREIMENEGAPLSLEPILSVNNCTEYTKIAFSESNYEAPLKQTKPDPESIEIQ